MTLQKLIKWYKSNNSSHTKDFKGSSDERSSSAEKKNKKLFRGQKKKYKYIESHQKLFHQQKTVKAIFQQYTVYNLSVDCLQRKAFLKTGALLTLASSSHRGRIPLKALLQPECQEKPFCKTEAYQNSSMHRISFKAFL